MATRNTDPVEQHIRVRASCDLHRSAVSGKVVVKDRAFKVYVAETSAQKTAGLEVVERLDEDEGMLFPFEPEQHVTFHMGSVRFPIDILFLMQGPTCMRIAKIIHDVSPGSKDHWANDDTVAVLEINGGLCKRLGIKVGDDISATLKVSMPDD